MAAPRAPGPWTAARRKAHAARIRELHAAGAYADRKRGKSKSVQPAKRIPDARPSGWPTVAAAVARLTVPVQPRIRDDDRQPTAALWRPSRVEYVPVRGDTRFTVRDHKATNGIGFGFGSVHGARWDAEAARQAELRTRIRLIELRAAPGEH
jgi:hypothetical protein